MHNLIMKIGFVQFAPVFGEKEKNFTAVRELLAGCKADLLVLAWAQQAMVTHCIENHVFAVTANRIGTEQRGEDNFTFTGQG
ncbi:MAG: hypothetical protein WCI48_00775 [Bacteroidota bacterium]|jgi:predicted amidohydrolase